MGRAKTVTGPHHSSYAHASGDSQKNRPCPRAPSRRCPSPPGGRGTRARDRTIGTLPAVSSELTEAAVIADGGWHSRYARVLLVHQFGDQAIVLVDGNGDGAEVEYEHWFLGSGGWVGGSSQGIGSLGHRPIWTWGALGGSGFVIGCTPDAKVQVTVEWLGKRSTAVPDAIGLWIALFPGLELPPEPDFEMAKSSGFRRWAPGEWDQREAQLPKLVAT